MMAEKNSVSAFDVVRDTSLYELVSGLTDIQDICVDTNLGYLFIAD